MVYYNISIVEKKEGIQISNPLTCIKQDLGKQNASIYTYSYNKVPIFFMGSRQK